MAADGAIKISTQIDIKRAEKNIGVLQDKMNKLAREAEKTQKEMEEIGKKQIPTDEFKEITSQIEKSEKKLVALNDRMEKWLAMGKNPNSNVFKGMQYDAERLEKTIEYAKGELKDLIDSGEAYTPGTQSSAYSNLQEKLFGIQSKQVSSARQIEIEELKKSRAEIRGIGDDSEEVDKVAKRFEIVRNVLSNVSESLNKFGSRLLKISSHFGKMALNGIKSFTRINKHANNSSNVIEKFGKRIWGLAKRVFVFSLIAKGFRSMISGIKEGFQNYMVYDDALKQSIISLKESINELKANLGSAFEPIVTAILPYLQQFVSYLNTATTAVNQFISTMMGRTSFKKALSGIGSVADSADKTANGLNSATDAAKKLNKELGKYDELNVISQQKNTGASGGIGKTDKTEGLGIGYEDVPISQQISEFAERIKEAWKNADFTEIGQIFGKKINQALEMIDWKRIQEVLNRIAKSIATFLNGAIRSIDWLLVGKTITNGINTAFQFVNTFATNFDFSALGKAIGYTINGGLKNLDWNLIKQTAFNIFSGVANTLNEAIRQINWTTVGNALANGINTIINGAYGFLSTFDFAKFGTSLGDGVKGAIHDIDWHRAGEVLGMAIQGLIDMSANFIKKLKFSDVKNAFEDFFRGVAGKVNMVQVAKILIGAIGASITLSLVKTALATAFTSLVGWIGLTLSGIIATVGLGPVALAIAAAIGAGILAKNVYDKIKENGGNIIEGLKEGIWEPIKKIGSWIKSHIFDPFIDGIKSIFGIHSPATTMKEPGENIGLGLLEGINSVFVGIAKWIKEHILDKILNGIKNAKEFFKKAGEELWGGIKNAYDGAKKTIIATITIVKDKAFDTAKNLWDGIKDKTATVTTAIKEVASSAWSTIKSWFGGKNDKNTMESTATLTIQPKLPAGWIGIAKFVGDYVEVKLKVSLPFGFSLEKIVGNKVKVNVQLVKKGWSTIGKFIGDSTNVGVSLVKKGWSTISKFVGDTITVYVSLNKRGWQTIAKFIGDSVNVSVSLNRKGWQSIDKYIGTSVNVMIGLSKSGWRTIQDFVGRSVEVAVYLRQSGQNIYSMVPRWVEVPVYFAARNSVQSLVPSWVEVPVYFKAMNSVSATRREKGGVYSFGSWHDIPQFASGGIPDHGSLAFIGENGPEILGHVNGRTEVLNKSQIASAIYQAVISAMSQAMSGIANGVISQMIDDTRAVLEIGGDMLKAVQNPVNVPVGAYNYTPANTFTPVQSGASFGGYGAQRIEANINIDALANAVASRINIPVNITGDINGRQVFDTMVNINQQRIQATGINPMGGGRY